jgi:Zn-dependent protease with chaperone function
LVDRLVFKTEEGHGPAFIITSIIAQLVFGIIASVIVFWFSRQREFRADAGGARLAGRDKMAPDSHTFLTRWQRLASQATKGAVCADCS